MIATTGFAHSNLIDAATLLGGSWDDLERLQSGHLWKPATSTDATVASTRVDFDFGSAVAPRLVWVPAHNCTSAGTIQVTQGATLGASGVWDSGELSAWPFTPLDGFDGRYFGIPVFMPGLAGRYLRIQLRDTANPAGELWMSRPHVAGGVFLPWINPVKLTRRFTGYSSVKRTVTGTDWRTRRAPLRGIGLGYRGMTEAEASLYREILRTHDTTGEVVYIDSTQDRARQQQNGFLGLMRELGETEYEFWRHEGFAVGIDERGGAPA